MDHRLRLVPTLREFRAKGSSNLEDLFRDAKELPAASQKYRCWTKASIAKGRQADDPEEPDKTASPALHNAGAPTYAGRGQTPAGEGGRALARLARQHGFVGEAGSGCTRGMMIQYNFCRRHDAPDWTPAAAAAAGLVLHGDGPWPALYTHVVRSRIKRGMRAARNPETPYE